MGDARTTAMADFAAQLIDQKSARVIVEPNARRPGFWFGGGNIVEDDDGTIYVSGRFRNKGDSTTGLDAGERGLELAIYASDDRGRGFNKVLSLTKDDLSRADETVLSIEGSALAVRASGVELFVSSEKAGLRYPEALRTYQKPGTGVWSIDRIAAEDVESLASSPVEPLLSSSDPEWIHIKDPACFDDATGRTFLLFCTHPYTWASSNSAYAVRETGGIVFGTPVVDYFPRGLTWDVSVTRVTDVLLLREKETGQIVNLAFYDGAECMRSHPENARAVSRPRGYSCEEIAGLAWFEGSKIDEISRISRHGPLFVSPYGTGCSRYIHAAAGNDGVYAVWQQAQEDGSQPLVMNFVPWSDIDAFERPT